MISLIKILEGRFFEEDNYDTIKIEDFTVHSLKMPYTHPILKIKTSSPKFTQRRLEKIYDTLRYIESGLKKTKLPPEWRRLEIYIEPLGAKEGITAKMKGTERTDTKGFYLPSFDVIFINSLYAYSNVFDYRHLVSMISHELAHRIQGKFLGENPLINTRLTNVVEQLLKRGVSGATKFLKFSSDYGIEHEEPEEFFAELVSHMITYPTDEKYKLWQKILDYILKGKK